MIKPKIKHLVPSCILIAIAAGVYLPMSRMMAAAEILVVDPMEAVYPDIRPPALRADAPLAAPLGGTMLVQVVLTGEPGQLQIERMELVGSEAGAKWYALDFVPVEQNTGINAGTERSDGKKNPYVIRRAPFEIADALVPVGEGWDAEAWKSRKAAFDQSGRAAFAVRWPIALDTAPGLHRYTVKAKLKEGKTVDSHFSVQVYPVTVPKPQEGTFKLVQTSMNTPLAKAYHVPVWSDEFWALYGSYARTLVEGRQSTGFISLDEMAWDCTTGTEPKFGERLTRAINVLKAAGMRDYLAQGLFKPILPRDPNNPRWGINSYESPDFGTQEGNTKARALFAQVRKALEETGVSSKFKIQIFDEVPESDNALFVEAAKMLREEIPGVKIFEVINSPNLGIVDSVDAWCPLANVYDFRKEFFDQRKAAGQPVWIYTCMGPGGAWVNRLLDQERARGAQIPWFVYGYDLAGFLHWGANSWMSDPFKQSVVFVGAGDPNTNFLPAGDTHILYPGEKEAWISLRYEAQRLGAEDYEALNVYGKQDAEAARKLVFKHFPAMNTGPRDGASYWQARHDLLAAASGFPASGRVATADNQEDEHAASSPKKEPQSSGLMNWFRNLFSK